MAGATSSSTETHEPFPTELEKHPFWENDVESMLRPRTREMLETYAGIPPDKLVEHIRSIQKRAWDVAPFASVGQLTWLNPYILLHPAHDLILSRVKEGASILDCACMVAPDLRQLAYEGAPTDNMYGFDLEPTFLSLGFELYKDQERWKGHFFQANALNDFSTSPLGEIEAAMDIVWCAKFLHLFDREKMPKVAARLIRLLKPKPGSIFAGSQNGMPTPMNLEIPSSGSLGKFTIRLANAEDIKEIWLEAAQATGTQWSVESRLLDLRTIGMHQDDGSDYKRRTGYNLQWTATLLA